MIIDGVSVTIDESMFSEWIVWHGSGINAIHTACETNVPITEGYRIPLEMLIRAMLEHKCNRWAAASKGNHNESDDSGDNRSPDVGVSDVPSADPGSVRRDATGKRRRRANGTFTG